jgi:hypothetical protein
LDSTLVSLSSKRATFEKGEAKVYLKLNTTMDVSAGKSSKAKRSGDKKRKRRKPKG